VVFTPLRMRKPSCSLIISTYNRASALRLCLESVRLQKVLPDEIVIADDGSADDTKQLVETYKKDFPVPVIHVWQPDDGYQLAKIRNRAFAAATGEYLIQIDGDLILHPSFIADHLRICKPGTFVSGTRALINEAVTEQMLKLDRITIEHGSLGKKYNAYRSRLASFFIYLFQKGGKNVNYVLGCNMAFWKKDLLTINGYDESFVGWGKEDNDISIRLINAGVELRFLKFGGIVYHLFHKEREISTLGENEKLLQNSIANKVVYVSKGIDQYL